MSWQGFQAHYTIFHGNHPLEQDGNSAAASEKSVSSSRLVHCVGGHCWGEGDLWKGSDLDAVDRFAHGRSLELSAHSRGLQSKDIRESKY